MKIIRKLFILISALTLTASLGLGAFASEGAREDYSAVEPVTETETEEAASNPFESLFSLICEYSSEIFSALAFVGTLIVAHFYKRGMLPTLRSALGNISSALSSAGERTESALIPIGERAEDIGQAIEYTRGIVDGISSSLLGVEKRLASLEVGEAERASYKTIMLSQIDMLYDIFMSTSLPQYKKDEIGERVAAMKKELKESDEGGVESRE